MLNFFKRLISSLHRAHILIQIGIYVYFYFFNPSTPIDWTKFDMPYIVSLVTFGIYAVLIILLEPFATPTISEVLEEKHKLESYEKKTDDHVALDKIPTIVDLKPPEKSRKGLFGTIFILSIIFFIIFLSG